jgi:hypothetical protein
VGELGSDPELIRRGAGEPMNLKSFHLVFIACSSALAFLFGAWALGNSGLVGGARVATAAGAFALGAGLVGYELWFLRYSGRGR